MAAIVSFHLQRFYIWILIFHHQPIRPPSHQQRGRDPPVMTGADSRFYCDATATAATTGNKIGIWAQFFLVVCKTTDSIAGLRGLQPAPGASRSRSSTDKSQYPWEGCWWSAANRRPETTFSQHKVREVSNQRWCHRHSSMGIVGGLGPTTGTVDPLPDRAARGQNMSDIHTTVTLHGNYSPQIPSSQGRLKTWMP